MKLPIATITSSKKKNISLSWIVPAITIVLAIVLYARWEMSKGPMVTIYFKDAGGITVESPVIYRGAIVGRVKYIELSKDMSSIAIKVQLVSNAKELAVNGTMWWIVKPNVSLEGVSGLETIVGPRYIELSLGKGEPMFVFTGSEHPVHENTKNFTLITNTANNISIGCPLYYRGVTVGQITEIILGDDSKTARLNLIVDKKYTQLVRTNTKFWNISGLSFEAGFTGLSINSGPITSWIKGGISMATPNSIGDIAPAGYGFTLEDDLEDKWLDWSPSIQLTNQSENE